MRSIPYDKELERREYPAPQCCPSPDPQRGPFTQDLFGRFLPRVAIEDVRPCIDHGRFDIKRIVGDRVTVSADLFADGHEVLRAVLRFRHEQEADWREVPMEPAGDDRWAGSFVVERPGRYLYGVESWVDRFASWRNDLVKKFEAGRDVSSELLEGAQIIEHWAAGARNGDQARLREAALRLRGNEPLATTVRAALDPALAATMAGADPRAGAIRSSRLLGITVDRERARFSAWYEMFPRSAASESGRHGTFRDVEKRLKYVAAMGFHVLYLPPIHPIGGTNRKGRNNSIVCRPGDPGSPWAIGSQEGGHKAVHPQLGTLEDFRRLADRAREFGLEIALDLAFQCSPDHPWVREHPEWFRKRPDDTIKHAENPPKKYEDIFPIDFETPARRELWEELRFVTLFWIEQGVRIFRVDNPHTKPFSFWEWLIAGIKHDYPEVIFLAEAFTRPKIMYRLAKLGFTQSYTYFAWRNTKRELVDYFSELTRAEVREYLRPSLWPNTPDILNEYLQVGGCPAFMSRLLLAATLSGNYGIYGPAFELCVDQPAAEGSEEYLHSEKYEIRAWDLDAPHSLRDLITRLNWIRREHAALRNDWSLRFLSVNNEQLLAFGKTLEDGREIMVVVVSLDPHHTQSGWLELPGEVLGVEEGRPYKVQDLLSGKQYLWQGSRNYVEVDPRQIPATIFNLRRRLRTERDFEYYV